MAGVKSRAFTELMHWRGRAQRPGIDRFAQRHPRLRSLLQSFYHPLYRLLAPQDMFTANLLGLRVSAGAGQRDLALLLLGARRWESGQMEFIESLLDEGMVFVDVGAHIGIYSLLAARRVGPRGKVYAFEPAPENFRALLRNIAQNGFSNIVAEPLAVSRGCARAAFALSRNDSASHSLANGLSVGRQIEVETTSLDNYFADAETSVDVVKLDAEGAEPGILDGMRETLSRNPDLILFTEVYPRAMEACGNSPVEFLRKLRDLGFLLAPFGEGHAEQAALSPEDFSGFVEKLRARGAAANLLCGREGSRACAGIRTSRAPLVSIAIPTYNRGPLLERTLGTILPQLREDFEVVVYDTGSTDGTRECMERLAAGNSQLRLFSLSERRSLDETLLLLLDEACGEYIWFFSSDDLMRPGAVDAVRRRILEAKERPALVYVNQRIVDERGQLLITSQAGPEKDRDFPNGRRIVPWLGLNLGFISASVIRRASALRASSSSEFVGTRSLNLHLYLRCLLEGGSALYVGRPFIEARRVSGKPPYEYRDVFVDGIVRILRDAQRRGFGRLALYGAMHRIVAGQYLRLVFSWRCDDPDELARTFPSMLRACWLYPAFWFLVVPARLAPAGLARTFRGSLREWRAKRNQRAEEPAEKRGSRDRLSSFGLLLAALLRMRKLIALTKSDRAIRAIPGFVRAYRSLYARLRPKGTISLEFRGHTVSLDADDLEITRSVLSLGGWERFETEIFNRVVGKGMTVVDVGANVGHYTLEAARNVGEEGKVYAFEPEPRNFDLLCRNVNANGYRNVIPVRAALSDRAGTAGMILCGKNMGGHRIRGFAKDDFSAESINVETMTLDECLGSRGVRVDAIKMDAEGWEPAIFQGMRSILDRNADLALFTEFSPMAIRVAGFSPLNYLEQLAEAGFRMGVLDENTELVEPLSANEWEGLANALSRKGANRDHVNLVCLRGHAGCGIAGLESLTRDSDLRIAARA